LRVQLLQGRITSWTAPARRRRASTPARLRLLRLLVAATSAVLFVSGSAALATALVTETNVHQQTVSAIVGVQRLHAWLAAADRSAANSYLSGGAELTLPQQQYEADIAAAGRELEQAAERQPGEAEVSQRLQAISQELGEYTRLIDTAMVQHRLGNPDGMVALRAASEQMHRPRDGILAQLEAVEAAYTRLLQRTSHDLAVSTALLAVFAATAFSVLGVLAWTQRFVRRRFRRRRNKRLLAATTAAVLVLAGTAMGAAGARQSIVRSQGQYVRLLNLWHARSLAYDVNGATSRFLIGGARAGTPLGDDPPVRSVQALLAEELRTAGSPSEQEAARRVVSAFEQFQGIDAAVREQATSGHQSAAVALTLGTYGAPLGLAFKSLDWGPRLGAQRDWSEGELGYAFEQFDWDLAQLTQMLQAQFDATMDGVERTLAEALGLQALSVAVAALTFSGLRPRLAEYAA
jgi:hypothetical protein